MADKILYNEEKPDQALVGGGSGESIEESGKSTTIPSHTHPCACPTPYHTHNGADSPLVATDAIRVPEQLRDGIISLGSIDEIAIQGWTYTGAFTSANNTTTSWAAGNLILTDGTIYAIGADDTGVMAALNYIYFDLAVSTVAFQTTTVAGNAIGTGKILIAIAQNVADVTKFAWFFQYSGKNGIGGTVIGADNIVVANLAAIKADLGAITAGTITLPNTGWIKGQQTDYNTGIGFFLGYSGDYKLSIGNPDRNRLTWDGANLTIAGLMEGGAIQLSYNDGYTTGGVHLLRNPYVTILDVDGGDTAAYVQSSVFNPPATWDTDMDFGLTCKVVQPTWFQGFIGLHSKATTYPDTARHIGFFFDTGTLYASNGNGTNQTKTDISAGLTLTNWNTYKFIYDAGTNIKFYINNVLKATHTTNLPSTNNDAPAIHTVIADVTANPANNSQIFIKHTPACAFIY